MRRSWVGGPAAGHEVFDRHVDGQIDECRHGTLDFGRGATHGRVELAADMDVDAVIRDTDARNSAAG